MQYANKTLPVVAGLLSFSLLVPVAAQAAQFDAIYAFGDSLSDVGNVYAASGDTFPPAPYYNGLFSNGPTIWIQDVAASLGLPLTPSLTGGTDYAFGGATTGLATSTNPANTISPSLPGLQNEIGLFQSSLNNQPADPNALYTIWAGANDFLPTTASYFTPYTDPTVSLNNIAKAIDNLISLGAKNFLVLNLPDLGDLPATNDLPIADRNAYNNLTSEFNAQLLPTIEGTGLPSDVNLTELDVNSLFNNVLADPSQYGFTDVADACLNTTIPSLCSNPNQYLFWDDLHPTFAGQTLIAQAALNAIHAIPESSPTLGLILLGGFGLGRIILKKTNRK